MIGSRLPDAARAVVADGKVRDYLLAADHPGSGKAGFVTRFGFTRARWQRLRAALAARPVDNPVVQATPAGGGTRVRVRCNLAPPDGRNPCVTTVGAIEGGLPPRFITALPGPPPPAIPAAH